MADIKELIKIIVMVAVVAVAIFFLYKAFGMAYSGLKVWSDLTQSQQDEVTGTLNSITANMQQCRDINDEKCICRDVLPSFPQTFRKEISLELNQEKSDVNISLLYGKNKVEGIENKVNMAKIYSAAVYSNEVEKKEERSIYKFLLKFENRDGFPTVKGKEEFMIISPNIYKDTSKSVLYFIVYAVAGKKPQDEAEFFNNLPKCMPNRKEAIEKFDSFIANLVTEKEIIVELPSEYRIFYGGKVIKLDYEGNDVIKTAENKNEVVRKFYDYNIKCANVTTADYLISGDKINITKTGSEFCIEKI